jgi:putative photosynthetic complex assembly protein
MSAIDKEPFPRPALYAAGALIALSIVAAAMGRHAQLTAPPAPAAAAPALVDSVRLSFADEPDGSVRVIDAETGATIATLAPGEDAFIRGVMRGFVRTRASHGIEGRPPFLLTRDVAGRVVIADPETGKRIDLRAFGPTNRDAFARLLTPTP